MIFTFPFIRSPSLFSAMQEIVSIKITEKVATTDK
jgi:hypothetical protein